MAISADFPGVTISIRINNRKLTEYRDADIQDPPRTVSYMIEAVPDSIFSIHAHASPEATFRGSSLSFHFYADGKYADGTLIDASQGIGGHTESRGRYVRSDMLRRYQFASREKQIEVIEKQSTSLSSRPRASKRSTDTPQVSYTGYHSVGIDSAAPTPSEEPQPTQTYFDIGNEDHRGNVRREAYRSVAHAASKTYHSVARPTSETLNDALSSSPEAPPNEADLPFRMFAQEPPPVGGDANVARGPFLGTLDRLPNTRQPFANRRPDLNYRPPYTDRRFGVPLDGTPLEVNDQPLAGEATPGRPEPVGQDSIAFDTAKETPAAVAALSTTKDASSTTTVGSDYTTPEELGTLKIVVCHVNKKGVVAFGRNASTTAEIAKEKQEAIKEKSGGFLVRYTAPQTVSPVTTWDVGALEDDNGDNSMTYIFHYRTREMLDALGVLSNDPNVNRVKPPVDGEWGPRDGSAETMADAGGATRRKSKVGQASGSRAKNVAFAHGGAGGEAVVSKREADEDWEMVDDDNTDA
ncbi:uncharacterized protein RCC_10474 [Ramularia collo-cygni]|uniref:DUF7918 domain-containing protein n=1 Tax=Ramularia collo-cygni TaxID=112498 RepID=A0A2D3V5U8_9PEZI|nr:uncharacterized protein RCC_10474 [Ramularia collo-cygni]CZT24746.1 uncharacterized protein RCC_10474 [Ramularia collo-cygni]